MKITAGMTFALFSKSNTKSGKRFKGLFLARKSFDTAELPPRSISDLEGYLREEGFVQNLEVNEWTFREDQSQAA